MCIGVGMGAAAIFVCALEWLILDESGFVLLNEVG